jgi:general secretion pathway protein A
VYEVHYGFTEKPFNLTPDPKYLYLSAHHTEAFAHLDFGRRERGGFVVITGEVGTGKTTLARYFLGRLGAQTASAFVLYPALSAAELLESILQDLKVPYQGRAGSLKDLVDTLHRFLLRCHEGGRDVVLVIDEAQDLSAEVLEQIRLISNLETDTEKLITFVLMGQTELRAMLARHELRQLAQRITARYHLSALSRNETEDYVRHRLEVAGGTGKVTFTQGALTAVHRHTGGVPRLINLTCDRALLAGYVNGDRVITAAMVLAAVRDLTAAPRARRNGLRYAALGAALALAAAGLAWRLSAAPPRPAPSPPTTPPPAVPAPQPSVAPSHATVELDSVLLTLPAQGSLRAALWEIEALWGGPPLERTSLRTHLDHIRRLDLPVALEMFHPARRETCYLALVRLEGNEAVVATGAGAPLRVAVADLDRLWTRQAVFLWRDFEAVADQEDRRRAWALEALPRLGYFADDADLVPALARFQRDHHLTADGVIGSRTLMTLYSRGDYPRPRLSPAGGGAS